MDKFKHVCIARQFDCRLLLTNLSKTDQANIMGKETKTLRLKSFMRTYCEWWQEFMLKKQTKLYHGKKVSALECKTKTKHVETVHMFKPVK